MSVHCRSVHVWPGLIHRTETALIHVVFYQTYIQLEFVYPITDPINTVIQQQLGVIKVGTAGIDRRLQAHFGNNFLAGTFCKTFETKSFKINFVSISLLKCLLVGTLTS